MTRMQRVSASDATSRSVVEAFVRMTSSPEMEYTCVRTNASTPHEVISVG